MESSFNIRPVVARDAFHGVKFSTLWESLKNDEPEDFVYHDGDTWCTDEHLPPGFDTAEEFERNKLNFAWMLRNDRVPVGVVNRIFKDERVQEAVARGLTVGDVCMIRGRAVLFGAMREAEGAMRECDQYDDHPRDSFGTLCRRQAMQNLLALYQTAGLTRRGHPVVEDENGTALERDGAKIFSDHEQAALRSTAWCRAMGTFSGRLERKYGPDIASQVLASRDLLEDMRQREVDVYHGYHFARFEDERFWTFDDKASDIQRQVDTWIDALPTRDFLAEHATACYIRGAIGSDRQKGKARASDGRAAVMLASAGHHVVGKRDGSPLLEGEKRSLQQVVEDIENRCIHDRLEIDFPVRDTLPWYVALHRRLEAGIVPPGNCLFDDVEQAVDSARRRATKAKARSGYERV